MNASRLSAIAWMLIGLALVFPSAAFGVHLEFVAEVPGTILDVTPKRILYSVSENGRERLRILDRSTGAVQAVPDVLLRRRALPGRVLTGRESSVGRWS